MSTYQYDATKWQAIGIGNRIEAHHWILWAAEDMPTPADQTGLVNCLVEQDDNFLVLAAIPQGRPISEAHPDASEPILKTSFSTGATRSDATGRGRFDLIPYEAMLSLARRYELGAVHFGDRNWERGQPLSRLLSSMRRHAHQIGYDYREDHVGAVLWNAAAFVTMVSRMEAGILPKELDDIGYFLNREASK
jgi:hypothetical protein